MIPEVLAAAKFWAQQLKENVMAQRVIEASKRAKNVPDSMMRVCRITDDQIYAFEYHLTPILMDMCSNSRWDVTTPDLGSYFRVVGTDYNADVRLAEAAEKAGITSIDLYLPWKTKTWINPGVVIARLGEGPLFETIYKSIDFDEITAPPPADSDADRDRGTP